MIKSFRGLLSDEEQDTIRLTTNNGLTGYRIKKFQIMPNTPGGANSDHVIKLYAFEQGTVAVTVDFDDSTLLGVCYCTNATDAHYYPRSDAVIFDNTTFNQDIFITHIDTKGSEACNYYLELEQVKLDVGEAAVATLKDMRGTN